MPRASQGIQTAWQMEPWPGACLRSGQVTGEHEQEGVIIIEGHDTLGLLQDLGSYSSFMGKALECWNQRSDVICFTFLKAHVGCFVEDGLATAGEESREVDGQ